MFLLLKPAKFHLRKILNLCYNQFIAEQIPSGQISGELEPHHSHALSRRNEAANGEPKLMILGLRQRWLFGIM